MSGQEVSTFLMSKVSESGLALKSEAFTLSQINNTAHTFYSAIGASGSSCRAEDFLNLLERDSSAALVSVLAFYNSADASAFLSIARYNSAIPQCVAFIIVRLRRRKP